MTDKKPRYRRTVLMTSGLTASAAVIAFTVAAAPNTDGAPTTGDEASQSQPYDDPEPPEAA
ncbi:MAG: hypothetical protein ABWX84_03160 [Nocardioides sp.]